MCWLKQLDWISVGIFQLNLFPARPYLHFISLDEGLAARSR